MKYIPRKVENDLKAAARNFSALILTGPRRAGKTTLFHRLFPKAAYLLLEDPDQVARAAADWMKFRMFQNFLTTFGHGSISNPKSVHLPRGVPGSHGQERHSINLVSLLYSNLFRERCAGRISSHS